MRFISKKQTLLLILFSSFNLQINNQLLLPDFLNSVGQLKYRGTSVLFRLNTPVQDLLRTCKSVIPIEKKKFFINLILKYFRRFKDFKIDNQSDQSKLTTENLQNHFNLIIFYSSRNNKL